MVDLKNESGTRDNGILIGVQRKGVPAWEVQDNLDELEQLADTAGADTVARVVQNVTSISASTLVGEGKVQQIAGFVEAFSADVVIFDDDLTPAQIRNLEKKLSCRVIDRSWLILDIFARRAKSKEARIQVELAQLKYMKPRLTGQWKHLGRQEGGVGTRRGPGETQLEVDRRTIGKRIAAMQSHLDKIERDRHNRRRRRHNLFTVAIVGYTNAGKSTLLNTLTHSTVFVEDRLFATLDPSVRSLRLPTGKRILLVDTVGFIRKLPLDLVASFRSTLEESRHADLFINLIDLSHPHWEGQLSRTEEILTELELNKIPQILAFNKVDIVEDRLLIEGLNRQYPDAVMISAARGIRLHELKDRITSFAERRWVRNSRVFRTDEARELKDFEESGAIRVLGRSFKDGMIHVDFLMPVEEEVGEEEMSESQ